MIQLRSSLFVSGEPSTATKPEKHSAGPKGKKGAKDTKDGRTSKSHQPTVNSRPGSQVIGHFESRRSYLQEGGIYHFGITFTNSTSKVTSFDIRSFQKSMEFCLIEAGVLGHGCFD